MKRILCLAILILFLFSSTCPVYAIIPPEDAVVTSPQKQEEIDRLFALRRKLARDFEANQAQINMIDQQLETLGVQEVSYQYLLNKLGVDLMPCVNVESTDTVRWTSRRDVMNYHGILYEYQILEAVPTSASSPLESTQAGIVHQAAGLTAGITHIVELAAVKAIESTPVIGEIVSVGGTIYDAISGIYSVVSPVSVIDNAQGTALACITTHVKFIFVKRYQSPDVGNQVLCYMGSAIDYYVATTTRLLKYDPLGVKIIDTDVYGRIDNEITSAYYNEYTRHVQVYHDYKVNGITNFNVMYQLTKLDIRLCGALVSFEIPFEYPNYV